MFDDLLGSIKKAKQDIAARRRAAFDERLRAFGSESAKAVSWAPATAGGVGFRTRTMKASGTQLTVFRASLLALLISGGSMAFGFWLIARFVTPGIAEYIFRDFFGVMRAVFYQLLTQTSVAKISVTLFALVFVTIGLVCLYQLLRPIQFDHFNRTFTKGYPFHRAASVSFNDIEAIQILSETCRGTKSGPFLSYELNLVLKDKSRITVVDHADISEIQKNGDALSKLLSVPVWDITKT